MIAAWLLKVAESESDILGYSQMRKKRKVLEDQVDRSLVRWSSGDVNPVEQNCPGGGLLEPGDHPQQSGFAATARAEKGEKLTAMNVERDAIDRREIGKSLARFANLNGVGGRMLLLWGVVVHRSRGKF